MLQCEKAVFNHRHDVFGDKDKTCMSVNGLRPKRPSGKIEAGLAFKLGLLIKDNRTKRFVRLRNLSKTHLSWKMVRFYPYLRITLGIFNTKNSVT